MNNYKTALVFFSIILTGCNTTAHMQFKKECSKIPENYFDKNLISSYKKENSVQIIYDERLPCSSSYLCSLIERADRWDNIHMMGEKSIKYIFYKDYKFKNCIANYSLWKENNFLDKKGKFCVASKNEKETKYNVLYSQKRTILYSNKNNKITKIENKIFYKDKLFLSYYMLNYYSPNSEDHCFKTDDSEFFFTKDFMWSK